MTFTGPEAVIHHLETSIPQARPVGPAPAIATSQVSTIGETEGTPKAVPRDSG